MAFISTKDFDAAVKTKKEENGLALQWRELPVGEIFYVKQRKLLNLKDETCMILTLTDKRHNTYVTWAAKRLADELMQNYNDDDVYIRSNGLKQSKTDPIRSYYDYNIIKA